MKRIAIIGGGISGLSAAFYLEKARTNGCELDYALFESGQRLGGCMSSDYVEGCLVEAGPDSFLTEKLHHRGNSSLPLVENDFKAVRRLY